VKALLTTLLADDRRFDNAEIPGIFDAPVFNDLPIRWNLRFRFRQARFTDLSLPVSCGRRCGIARFAGSGWILNALELFK
jgi:hypothetical protein